MNENKVFKKAKAMEAFNNFLLQFIGSIPYDFEDTNISWTADFEQLEVDVVFSALHEKLNFLGGVFYNSGEIVVDGPRFSVSGNYSCDLENLYELTKILESLEKNLNILAENYNVFLSQYGI